MAHDIFVVDGERWSIIATITSSAADAAIGRRRETAEIILSAVDFDLNHRGLVGMPWVEFVALRQSAPRAAA